MQAELKPLSEIRYWVSQVLGPEQVEASDKAEGKQSVVEQWHKKGEPSKTIPEEKSKETNSQRKTGKSLTDYKSTFDPRKKMERKARVRELQFFASFL